MPGSDPTRRALHLGCGPAVSNLRVAATHAGRVRVVRLLPDPDDPELLAAAHLAEPAASAASAQDDDELARLYPAIHR